jgi:Fe/S biogenesis protein NfuA
MIAIGETAQTYFKKLIEQQGDGTLGVKLTVADAGTPRADCKLEFCEGSDLDGNEWIVECEGFNVYLDAASAPYLEDAEIDLKKSATGHALTIKAPSIKGRVPGAEAGLVERVQYVIDSEINPQLASHGGRVALVEITNDMHAVLRFGGGCHGCGMVDVTLKNGIEKTLTERVPEIAGVRDATDHATGAEPYMKRA